MTGTPQIPMTIGSNTRNATYESGSGGTDLVFSYTVVTADVDNDGLEIAAGNVALNGGTIKTTVGDTAAAIDHGGVSASTAHKVDGGAASVSTVEFINKPTGNYVAIGDSIEVKVTFDRPVTVNGAPRVTLSPAFGAGSAIRRAAYRSGSGSPALVFRYVLQDGDDSGGTNVSVAANALKLNSGTIRTGTENATITHTAANAGKTVSAKRPRISVVEISTPAPSVDADQNGKAETFVNGQLINVVLGFDQDIEIDRMNDFANVQIELTIGTTHYPLNHGGRNGTSGIWFSSHTVAPADRDDDGIKLRRLSATNNVIKLAGDATIKGTAANGGNTADLTLTADPKVTWKPSDEDRVTSLNVRGNNQAPTTGDFSVGTPVDTDYTFSATNFTYADTGKPTDQPTYVVENDPLKEIQITRLPAGTAGTLKLSGTVIPSGDLPKTVSKSNIANLVFDPATSFNGVGSFAFKVVDSFGAASDTATATIAVGEPVVSIARVTSPVTEGTAAQFSVTSTRAPSSNLTVNLTVSEASGSDYVAAGNEGAKTVIINSGSTSASYSVPTVGDSTDEPDGSVTVAVGSGTGYSVGTPSSATVMVNDDDLPPMAPAACGTVNDFASEHVASVSSTATSITVMWGGTLPAPGAQNRGQICNSSGTSAFLHAANTALHDQTQTFPKFGHGDSAPALTADTDYWVRPVGYGVGGKWYYIRTKVSDPAVTIEAGTSPVTEGTDTEFTLTIAEAPSKAVTVKLTVSEASGSDYVAAGNEGSKMVTISAGSTTTSYSVPTEDDSTGEPNGSVKVTVEAGIGYAVGTPGADSVEVRDNDPPGVPDAPTVTSLAANSLGVIWTEVIADPSVTDYDIRYFKGTADPAPEQESEWTAHAHTGSATNTTITGLEGGAAYRVQVRAVNAGGPGAWSTSGSGTALMSAPSVPAACGTARSENPISSVVTTETGIRVVWRSSGFWAPHGSPQLCDSDGTTALLAAANAPPSGQTVTYTKFGMGDSAPALAPGTDYWIRWSGYGSGTAWVYARTAGVPGPAVRIAGGSAVTEGTAATFTLTIAEAPTADLTVNLTVSEASGSDFVAPADEGAKMATISMGNTTANFTVSTQGDSKDEPNGYVKVTVGTGSGYSVGSPAADSVTVNDDDTNNVATGAPAITGFPQVGQTLTAGTSGIADTDGLTSVSYSYQWIRTDSGTDTDIASATSSTYELTQADSAKTVKVKVTFQDDIGHDETLTSAASGTVQAAAPACDTGNAWCGTLTVAQSTGGGNMRSRGYCNGISLRCNTAYGSLDDTDFDLGGTTFVVKSVRWGGPSSSQVRLHLTLDQDFPSTSLSTLKLKVNGHEFALSDAAQLPAAVSNNYRWDSAP